MMRKSSFRMDGYMNAVMGSQRSLVARKSGLGMDSAVMLLEESYLSRGLSMTIVDRPAQDAMARGVTIEGDENNLIANEFDRLRVIEKMTLAMKQALLHGASAIMPICDDEPLLSLPLNLSTLKTVRHLRVVPGTRIEPGERLIVDETSPDIGQPEHYYVRPQGSTARLDVHHTRLFPVSGESACMSSAQERLPWQGRSALASCWSELRDYRDAMMWAIKILERKQTPIYSMSGMADLLMNAENGEELVQRRITQIDAARNLLRSIVIDKDDAYDVRDLSLAAVADIVSEARTALAAAALMPSAILFGDIQKGTIGASGEGELAVYHSRVSQLQRTSAYPTLERIVELLAAQPSQSGIGGEWKVTFNSLWEPSEKERAEAAKAAREAEAAEFGVVAAAMTAQVISPEEGREWLRMIVPRVNLSETMPEFEEPDPLEDENDVEDEQDPPA